MATGDRPHIVLVIARGEAIRNFVYSGTLEHLADHARVTLLSVVEDERLWQRLGDRVSQVVPLSEYTESALVGRLRYLVHTAHYRWIWSGVARNLWEWRDATCRPGLPRVRRALWKGLVRATAHRPPLEALTWAERRLSVALRPTKDFDRLFDELKPDVVFNCSHVHGYAADLPLKIASRRGIRTAAFIFSWDNLTSRSRIFPSYDRHLVWTERIGDDLRRQYPRLQPSAVVATGTPQFDFHFRPEFRLPRAELCQRIGVDPARPYVLYTTGMDEHFPEEHRTVEAVAHLLDRMDVNPKPQLVVRTYVKGTSAEMKALAQSGLPSTVFPEVAWDPIWFTPDYQDLTVYTSLVRHAALGVNAASTVSLELLLHDRPVVNLGFDPPGSDIPAYFRWIRHLEFDHYAPVVASGAVMPAYSIEELAAHLESGLRFPQAQSAERRRFLREMFGDLLDGGAGERVARSLLELAG